MIARLPKNDRDKSQNKIALQANSITIKPTKCNHFLYMFLLKNSYQSIKLDIRK